jgi:hypothetical protein
MQGQQAAEPALMQQPGAHQPAGKPAQPNISTPAASGVSQQQQQQRQRSGAEAQQPSQAAQAQGQPAVADEQLAQQAPAQPRVEPQQRPTHGSFIFSNSPAGVR